MRLKIVSGGTSANTEVVNAETGERVDGIVSVKWALREGAGATATLEIEWLEAEIEAEA